eukprot:15471487-Alexandrium_andersonii.AAC.1
MPRQENARGSADPAPILIGMLSLSLHCGAVGACAPSVAVAPQLSPPAHAPVDTANLHEAAPTSAGRAP